jgi:glycerophosphoryl diester phosphodiesterase
MKRQCLTISSAFFVLVMLSMGATMNCAADRSDLPRGLPWAGKFPVLVVAHRGFSGTAPENTLVGFKKAVDLGVDMTELDVHLSKDGEVVVIHDDTLNRTTNGKGKVADFTLKELKQLDAGSFFSPRFSGERIPTLQEVLELVKGKVPLNIELKKGDMGSYTLIDLADRAVQEIEKRGMVNQVIFASFEPSAVERIRERNPNVLLALNYGKDWNFPGEITRGKPISVLSCRARVLNEFNVSRAHKQGIKVFAWTLNKEEEMEQFLKIRVDGIITDYPDRLINILQKR